MVNRLSDMEKAPLTHDWGCIRKQRLSTAFQHICQPLSTARWNSYQQCVNYIILYTEKQEDDMSTSLLTTGNATTHTRQHSTATTFHLSTGRQGSPDIFPHPAVNNWWKDGWKNLKTYACNFRNFVYTTGRMTYQNIQTIIFQLLVNRKNGSFQQQKLLTSINSHTCKQHVKNVCKQLLSKQKGCWNACWKPTLWVKQLKKQDF